MTGSTPARTAVSYAVAQVGKPYRWGATGPDAFDCSGLVVAAYAAAGISVPRTTYQQLAALPHLPGRSLDSCGAGDLLYPDVGHVMLYLGGGQVVEAPHTGLDVRTRAVSPAEAWQARRVPAAGVTASASALPVDSAAGAASGGGLTRDLRSITVTGLFLVGGVALVVLGMYQGVRPAVQKVQTIATDAAKAAAV